MKRGFTLVELSVVMVIIGLLIGGILVGKSMISTSKIVKQAAQFQQFDSAVATFIGEYNALPGDAAKLGLGGDGNGAIDMTANCPGYGGFAKNTDIFCVEAANFWSEAFPDKGYSTNIFQATISGANQNVPLSIMGNKNSFVITAVNANSSDNCGWDPALAIKENFYGIVGAQQIISGNPRLTNSSTTNSSSTPDDLLALDTKMDDGNGLTGNVRSGSIFSCNVQATGTLKYAPAATAVPSCSDTTGKYLHVNTYACTPMVLIGSQNGMNK